MGDRVREMFELCSSVLFDIDDAGRLLIGNDESGSMQLYELAPDGQDTVVYKHRFSGFYETELHDALQGMGVRDLVFTGCTTSICVDSTVRDAMFRDYRCLVLEDCMAEPIGGDLQRTNHEASLLTPLTLLGWVGTSSDLLTALPATAETPG